MSELSRAREIISNVDKQMAELFQQRMEACKIVAAYKKENGVAIRDKFREEALINSTKKNITDSEIESYYVQFIQKCIDLSCDMQAKILSGMKVAFCGVEGAYAHIAAKKMFPTAQLVALPDFETVYREVEAGKYDCCVLPMENSYAGEVGPVMDLIFNGSLYVNQVLDLPISHNLMAVKGANIKDIKKVISHPQALAQCAKYIKEKQLEEEPYSNTAVAAKFVKEKGDKSIAAIASEDTAELFDLEILEKAINDNKNNTTRFAVLSRVQNKPAPKPNQEDEHFILVFTVKNEAGALAQTLNIIGAHGFNMRNLRSRPMKDLNWSYYFYIEADGDVNTENGQDMLKELAVFCAKLKLVGSYYELNTKQ